MTRVYGAAIYGAIKFGVSDGHDTRSREQLVPEYAWKVDQ